MAPPVAPSIDDDLRGASEGWPAAWSVALFGVFALLSLFVYSGALHGPFISDDYGYIVTSPYTRSLGPESVAEIFDLWGQAREYTANYAPVHLLLTALERRIFANDVLGFHLVNVLVHALVSVLLVSLLRSSGVPDLPAVLGGLFFALHPANVEAVAWISQLKTNASLALTLGALRALRRRAALATLLFVLGLLTKASAYAALPAAAAFTWAGGRRGAPTPGRRRQWGWLGSWALLFALYAIAEFSSFGFGNAFREPAYDDPWVHVRSVAAVGARYLVMSATSLGVSAFQEPLPVTSPWDPWWLAALPLSLALVWRTAVTLRERRVEAAYWVFAIASFGPVSQIFPFVNPVADRYLYFILPGLIGGTLLLGIDLLRRFGASVSAPSLRLPVTTGGRSALAVAMLVTAVFGARSHARARLWNSETRLLLDAVDHYPEGGTAAFLRARSAARVGDAAEVIAQLRVAERKHAARFSILLTDPGLAPIRSHPDFQALVREMAGRWIERAHETGVTTQPEFRVVGLAHQVRGEYAAAVRAFEAALEVGGPQDELVRQELARVRDLLAGVGGGES